MSKNKPSWDWSSLAKIVQKIKSGEISQKEASDFLPLSRHLIRAVIQDKELDRPNIDPRNSHPYTYDEQINILIDISIAIWRLATNMSITDLVDKLRSPW